MLFGGDPESVPIVEFTKSIRQLEASPDNDDVGWHQAEAKRDGSGTWLWILLWFWSDSELSDRSHTIHLN